jgi:bacteriophage N4 adsorption protein B
MPNELVLILFFVMWYVLVTLAILFSFSGLDDLFIDIYYWIRYLWRIQKTRHYKPLTYDQLIKKPQQYIAVLVPCWHEANVITTMLKHNCYSIDYKKYFIFVGVYPNDPDTVQEVQDVAETIPHVQCVIGRTPGPTNKAANLNEMYHHIKAFEVKHDISFSIFVFHDAEDIIHPLSFQLYNYLIPRKDMIQVPVFPLDVKYWNFTHWLYADEFAENHTKDIIVRESIRAHVPSAGVGTAFSRQALIILEDPETNMPFSVDSLTEDYRTSLAVREHQLKQIFVTQSITRLRWQKRTFFRKGYEQKRVKEYIATRALFPLEYKKAVRQKARWIIGIVFQEWDRGMWPKEWQIRYSLMRDRKAFITHFINGFGYFVFAFWIIYTLLTYANPAYPALQEQFNLHPWVWWLIVLVTVVMMERLLQRVIGTWRVYGWFPAVLSIPRAMYGNLLNLNAVIRAYRVYFTVQKSTSTRKQPAWDKTDHEFPGRHILVPFRRRLGDLLLEINAINPEQLNEAIREQEKTGERLGTIVCRLGFISRDGLLQLLAMQYQLGLFPQQKLEMARRVCCAQLSRKTVRWFRKQGVTPIKMDKIKQTIIIAIDDPTNELLLKNVIRYMAPFTVEFMLIDVSE